MVNDAQQIPAGYKQTDVGVIPEDWEAKRFGDVGSIKTCRRVYNHETKETGTVPFYKIGTFGEEADAYISESLYESYKKRFPFPKKSDILISASGTIGRTVVYNGEISYFQDSNIIWIDNDEKLVSNDYLHHIIRVTKFNTEGGTIQRLYNSILSDKEFICPPKPEQSVIARALSDIDSLISKLDQLIQKKKNIKQGAMQELLTGKRRMPGFSGEWKNKRLGDLLQYEQPTKYIVSSTEYSETNGVPVLTAGKSFILGYSDEENGIFNNLPVIIFDDFTTASKYVDFEFKVKSSAMKMLLPKSKNISLRFVFEKMQLIDFPLGDHKRRWISEFQDIELLMPEHKEQTAITEILENMNAEVSSLELQRNKYQDLKQGMMQQLLTGKIRLI